MYTFPLEPDEKIIKKGHASLHINREAWTGALYLTDSRLVFVGYVMDINTKYIDEIPLAHISGVKGGKTFFIIPNVIDIDTIRGRSLEFIVHKRNEWLEAINKELDRLS